MIELEGIASIAKVRPSRAAVERFADEYGVPVKDAARMLRGVTGGAGFIDALELSVLDHVMGNAAYSQVAQWFMALSTTTPTDAGTNFTEPSTGSYARVETEGTGTNGPAWASATGTAPANVANSEAINFPQATGDWSAGANMTHFGLFTASSAGTVQIWGALTTPKPVLNGDTASFAIGTVKIQLGDPGDTY